MWTRAVSALVASVAFHVTVGYLAQPWLRSHAMPIAAVLNVQLPPLPVVPMEEEEPLANTIEGEDAAEAEVKRSPSANHAAPTAMPARKLEKLLTRLSDSLPYPPEALAAGLEGETVLAVEVDAGARIVAVSVVSSSGHVLLDEAALRAVGNLRSLGPEIRSRSVLFPVRFELN